MAETSWPTRSLLLKRQSWLTSKQATLQSYRRMFLNTSNQVCRRAFRNSLRLPNPSARTNQILTPLPMTGRYILVAMAFSLSLSRLWDYQRTICGRAMRSIRKEAIAVPPQCLALWISWRTNKEKVKPEETNSSPQPLDLVLLWRWWC